MSPMNKKTALRHAWSKGFLKYKLYDYQEPLYNTLKQALIDPKCIKYVLNCSRRYGKTTILVIIALEHALQNKNAQIRFAASTARALNKIVNPIIKQLIDDCPSELRPKFNSVQNVYKFPSTGSEIHLAGTDNGNYDSLRGTASNLNIIDEAGFCSDLDHVLKSVLIPQTLTTGGKTLIASTPSATSAHDFFDIAMECKKDGFYSCFTIDDNTSIDQQTKDLYAKEAGGYDSDTFLREYMCKFVTDSNLSIIREWSSKYVQDIPRDSYYDFYHKYVALDIGVRDLTACLFGYYDFRNASLIIEDEFSVNGPDMTTEVIKNMIKDKESEHWSNAKPYRRIADNNNLILIQDLTTLHDLHFMATNKETLEAMINEVRMFVNNGRLKVHPRCKLLIGCLEYGVWDSKKSKFANSKVYGHFDHLAALVYLVRNLDQYTNPIPHTFKKSEHTHFIPQYKKESEAVSQIKKLFRKF